MDRAAPGCCTLSCVMIRLCCCCKCCRGSRSHGDSSTAEPPPDPDPGEFDVLSPKTPVRDLASRLAAESNVEIVKSLNAPAATKMLIAAFAGSSSGFSDARRCAACCAQLRDLGVPERGRGEVVAAGACEALVQAMERASAEITEALQIAAGRLEANSTVGFLEDTVDDVVAANELKRRVDDAIAVLEPSCWALKNMSAGEDAEACARKQHATEAGALGSVVRAMQAAPRSVVVQEQGCAALRNICYGSDTMGCARKQQACELGGLRAMAAAMATHLNEAGVLEQALCALVVLCGRLDDAVRACALALECGAPSRAALTRARLEGLAAAVLTRRVLELSCAAGLRTQVHGRRRGSPNGCGGCNAGARQEQLHPRAGLPRAADAMHRARRDERRPQVGRNLGGGARRARDGDRQAQDDDGSVPRSSMESHPPPRPPPPPPPSPFPFPFPFPWLPSGHLPALRACPAPLVRTAGIALSGAAVDLHC